MQSEKKTSRLIIVANRLPVEVVKQKDGLNFKAAAGGLATGLADFCRERKCTWIGWPGINRKKVNKQEQDQITEELLEQGSYPVFLSSEEIKDYYYGFCNKTIWPLFHYFPLRTVYEERYWDRYIEVNKRFCRQIQKSRLKMILSGFMTISSCCCPKC